MDKLLTIADYEARAKELMDRALFDRMFGSFGAPTWEGYTNNFAALAAIKLRPRVLVDVSHRDLSTEVLGQKISFPVMFAPTGGHQRAHPEGELATARAAGAAGTILTPNPPKDTDGRGEDSGRGWVRELQGRWPGVLG